MIKVPRMKHRAFSTDSVFPGYLGTDIFSNIEHILND